MEQAKERLAQIASVITGLALITAGACRAFEVTSHIVRLENSGDVLLGTAISVGAGIGFMALSRMFGKRASR